ncbi:fungal-specific transcription factor domain-containing protein [Cantharellus anzutake]|uniref:fungal-specific transcription factor domain-containing protein n=1 Tax=Cantharellus anzutake TaxID=1750568 RepID=UPI00190843EE|nr:fungal-specific transcription factor domain-containing protein [Cantharellus anzutake]KAF8340410.1 fungal-specific transcription factor domain-containing protein [Cantharellus anzutake]
MPKAVAKKDVSPDNDPPVSKRKPRAPAPVEDEAKEKRQRGKDGCLTCRMRRKSRRNVVWASLGTDVLIASIYHQKCETQRSPDGSCYTCTRLNLDCLGFGNKRPDWMRDKARLEHERQLIKNRLVAQGLVRGVHKSETGEAISVRRRRPRRPKSPESSTSSEPKEQTKTPYLRRPSTPSSSDEVAPPPTVVPDISNGESVRVDPSHNIELPSTTESPISPTTTFTSWNTTDASDHPTSPITSPEVRTSLMPQELGIGSSVVNDPYGSLEGLVPFMPAEIPAIPNTYDSYSAVTNDYFSDMTRQFQMLVEWGLDPQVAAAMVTQSLEGPSSYNDFSGLIAFNHVPKIRCLVPPTPLAENQEDLIFYYFSRVSQMQYIYDRTSVDTMHSFITRNPHGSVASAIIALSSLHDARMRAAEGGIIGHLRTSNSHDLYFNRAQNELNSIVKSGRSLTEAEATAALHLISWWLFQGGWQGGKSGGSGWLEALDVACDWYEKNSGILSSGPEPLKTIYKLNPEGRFAARTTMWMDIFSGITLLRPPRFSRLYEHLLNYSPGQSDFFLSTNGCCDEVMFCLSAIVNLEHNKYHDELSTMEPYDREVAHSDFILRSHKLRKQLLSIDCSTQPISPFIELSMESSSSSAYPFTHSNPNVPDTYPTSEIFRQAALLYLSTVTSGYSPSVSHTQDAVAALKLSLEAVPFDMVNKVDRSLVFPICLAGCMTDDLNLRNTVGNTITALQLMEAVWGMRDSTGEAVAWRDVMNEMKFELLMV